MVSARSGKGGDELYRWERRREREGDNPSIEGRTAGDSRAQTAATAIARHEFGSTDATNFSAPPEPGSAHPFASPRPGPTKRPRNQTGGTCTARAWSRKSNRRHLHRTGLVHGSHTQPISLLSSRTIRGRPLHVDHRNGRRPFEPR
jgi:hypothetical protein